MLSSAVASLKRESRKNKETVFFRKLLRLFRVYSVMLFLLYFGSQMREVSRSSLRNLVNYMNFMNEKTFFHFRATIKSNKNTAFVWLVINERKKNQLKCMKLKRAALWKEIVSLWRLWLHFNNVLMFVQFAVDLATPVASAIIKYC